MEESGLPDDWIASTALIAVTADGTRSPIVVRIGRPFEAADDEWQCALSLEGLFDGLHPVAGADSLQALGLAWRLAATLLSRFEASGGRLELDGERFPLEAYFSAPAPFRSES